MTTPAGSRSSATIRHGWLCSARSARRAGCAVHLNKDDTIPLRRSWQQSAVDVIHPFYRNDLIAADVYPAIWGQDWALSYLKSHYLRLAAWFWSAAADHEPILVRMALGLTIGRPGGGGPRPHLAAIRPAMRFCREACHRTLMPRSVR